MLSVVITIEEVLLWVLGNREHLGGIMHFIKWCLGVEYLSGLESWRQTLEWIARLHAILCSHTRTVDEGACLKLGL